MEENNSFVLQPDSEGGAYRSDSQTKTAKVPTHIVGQDVYQAHEHFGTSSPEDGEDQLMQGLGEI